MIVGEVGCGGGASYQFFCFLESAFCLTDGSLAWLAAQLGYLIKLLLQVGLHKTKLGGVALKELRAGICVERVGHDGRQFKRGMGLQCGNEVPVGEEGDG